MLYKTSLNDAEFHVLDLSAKRGRPKKYQNILIPLYTTIRAITEEKYKDIKDTTLHPTNLPKIF